MTNQEGPFKAKMFDLPAPQLQMDFCAALRRMRELCLQEALSDTVEALDVRQIDKELARLAPERGLRTLARKGLRGELLFAVPIILETNPHLLGYYRMLLGFSQKSFYGRECGLGRFKSMEQRGTCTSQTAELIAPLCEALASCAAELLGGVGAEALSKGLLDDLTLLTLGPQLRGGANVKKGSEGILTVFELINDIVQSSVTDADPERIELVNAAGRTVLIEFAPDPDLIIREQLASGSYRNIIAIEVKAGRDFSNIHNRIGEAEKSHQKARGKGFTECWTILNVDRIDARMAKRESPSTDRFFLLADLRTAESGEHADFRDRIVSLAGVRSPGA